MKITLIGMSNVGKSHWAKKLAEAGFRTIHTDDIVAKKLGVQDLSSWLGQPYEPRYQEKSKILLSLERETIEKILDDIGKSANPEKNVVIDPGGSVIYLKENILKRLKQLTKIVYLSTPSTMIKQMSELYLKNPKSVIWGDIFEKEEGESNKQALMRCYRKLLEYRTARYKELADITVDAHMLRKNDFTVDDFLRKIQ